MSIANRMSSSILLVVVNNKRVIKATDARMKALY